MSLKFKSIKKDRLFYDKWNYCISFYLAEANALRTLDHDEVTKTLENRRQWRHFSLQRYGKQIRDISTECEERLHALCDILVSTNYKYKHVVTTNGMWIYTNNIELLKVLDQCAFLSYKKFTQVQINRPKNSIVLKNPKHTHRSYFKMIKLSTEEKQRLGNFLDNQPNIRPSPSLELWLQGKFNRTQDYFFIDHDGDQWLLMLALVIPCLVRKTLEIVTDK